MRSSIRVRRGEVGGEPVVKEPTKDRWRRARGAGEGQGLPHEQSRFMHTAAYFMHTCRIAE